MLLFLALALQIQSGQVSQQPTAEDRVATAHAIMVWMEGSKEREVNRKAEEDARHRKLEADFWSQVRTLRKQIELMEQRHSVDSAFWPNLKVHANTVKQLRSFKDAK